MAGLPVVEYLKKAVGAKMRPATPYVYQGMGAKVRPGATGATFTYNVRDIRERQPSRGVRP